MVFIFHLRSYFQSSVHFPLASLLTCVILAILFYLCERDMFLSACPQTPLILNLIMNQTKEGEAGHGVRVDLLEIIIYYNS